MERRGKNMICAVDNTLTDLLGAFFTEPPSAADECCPPSDKETELCATV